ncbi:MAG: hypothetical protein A2075_06575 [Geobacteraceae bacterium GWC2_58_44]|nr:MAG: hypothetical protein A2075_06575 [Geobacteraceae bacterium GWC2_58_44]
MKISSKVLMALMVLAFHVAATPFSDAATIVDGPVARNKLQRDVKELLYDNRFAELEKLAKELRSTKARFPEGHWKLPYFYDGLAAPEHKSEKQWQRLLGRLEKWQKAYPESVAARVATASAWLEYGWEARGSGSSDSVTPEGLRLLTERRVRSLKLVYRIPPNPADDCPGRHALLLTVGKSLGWDRDTMSQLFKKAVAFEPRYYYFYGNWMDYMSTRWGGREGEWLSFIEGADALAGRKEDQEIYARMVGGMWQEEWKSFEDQRISWPRMKEGFRSIEREYPGSPYNLNILAVFSCLAGDLETARAAFAKIGNSPYLEKWREPVNFDECRFRAEGSGMTGRLTLKEIGEKGLDQQSLQTRQLAEEGDTYSQYRSAAAYRKGDWGEKDVLKAAKLMKLAAEKGYAPAQHELGNIYQQGAGVKRDDETAARWYLKAALQGYAPAQISLGSALVTGKGVRKDYLKAYAWIVSRSDKSGFESLSETIWNSLNEKERSAAENEVLVVAKILADCAEGDYAGCLNKNGSMLDEFLKSSDAK